MLNYNPYARKRSDQQQSISVIHRASLQDMPSTISQQEKSLNASGNFPVSGSATQNNAAKSNLVPSCHPPLAPQERRKATVMINPYKKKTTMSTPSHTNSSGSSFLQGTQDIPGDETAKPESQHIRESRSKPEFKSTVPAAQPSYGRNHSLSQNFSPITNPYRKRNLPDASTRLGNNFSSLKPPGSLPNSPSKRKCTGSTDENIVKATTPSDSNKSPVPLPNSPNKRKCIESTYENHAKATSSDFNSTTDAVPSRSANLKSIRPAGWENNLPKKTEPTKQSCELPGEPTLPAEISFSIDDVKPVEDGHRKDLVRNANLQKPLRNGWVLFPHQKKAILQGLVRRRMILALDMGLGKTLIGCVFARSFKLTFDDLKVFVICPVSLKTEWKRTAEEAAGLKVEDETENGKDESLDLRICSWAKVPSRVDKCVKRYIVVFDEAHSMQSMTSSRTKDSLKLVLDKRCIGVLLLTGTPMKNGKPSNLFPLLRAVRHPLGKNQMAYEKHFCDGMMKSFGRGKPIWDAKGCTNLSQLKRLVSSNLLHLTKEQCLTLPPLTRHRYEVPVSHRSQLQYIQAVKNLASLQAASVEKAELGEAVLGAVQKLRCLCSFAKVGATVELAKKILEEEPSVVIFTSFAEVAKNIHGQLSSNGWEGELLTGETPQKKRQAMVDKFQAGHSPVFVCTFGAGGVGLTLTVACSIILLDRPWTPGDTRQAEDRIRRIGQTKNVKSYWMTGFELDKQIDDMIESKEEASKAVLGEGEVSKGPAAKINIPRLLNVLIAKVN